MTLLNDKQLNMVQGGGVKTTTNNTNYTESMKLEGGC
jgi:hypothetical protein